ncbi:ChaN family lipoprotein [Breoghania sp.]|uniref:ChaN family lipoprotein n=1 Tax=Breoghania sp. TaxID=2065378 RepID=UPI002627350E|nr:ChaN family lipoprotein [Breoghania sp.]MDJ0931328.1 ChaN family lipoprotein [Breoghania sp.]
MILLHLAATAVCAMLVAPALAALPNLPKDWQAPLNRDNPLIGKIWSVKQKAFVAPEELAKDIVTARFVLAGETHDNPDHHLRQAWIVSVLTDAGRKPAVAFEIIPIDKAEALSSYLATDPADGSEMGTTLDWDKSGWPDWSMYRPIADAALAAKLPMVAGDVSKTALKRFRKEGVDAFGKDTVKRWEIEKPLPETALETLKQELRDGHCNLLPEPAVTAMVPVQRARDASLADALIANAGTDGAVLIAGRGRVRAYMAVPWYLRERAPDASMRIVAMVEIEAGETDPADYLPALGIYDYIWFTPKAERTDKCAELKERFKKKS